MARTNSPLRYPGGKSCLLPLTAELLKLNDLECGHYIEPYAGGCGLALSLLYNGHVAEIHINDIDPAIWAFWKSVLEDTEKMVDLIQTTPITVDEWRRQLEINQNPKKSTTIQLGFSTFFLNRTNRSGVIKGAGVIGGLDQTGPYKIDCRFNRDDLARRVTRIGRYRERIHLSRLDALAFLKREDKRLPASSFMFIDPPYFNKGAELYTSFYNAGDHATVAAQVCSLKRHWVVTYDNTPEIKSLYKDRRQYSFDISYSLSEKRKGAELLIASKGLKVPAAMRERQCNRPQYRSA